MSNPGFRKEARKCIEIQSHLTTCLYDWAVAHTLHKQQVLCWSTTIAYYSMMHSARTLFSLIEFDSRFDSIYFGSRTKRQRIREVMKFHNRFCSFLKNQDLNQNDENLRNLCIECFEEYFPHENWASFLDDLGKFLSIHKKARETETYEHFVVAHHGRKYHFEAPFLETLFQKSESDLNEIMPKILSFVLKYYGNQIPMQIYHLWHLKDELRWLEITFKKEELVISNQMKDFLNLLNNLVKNLEVPIDYMDFEREMDMNYYSLKSRVYNELENVAEELANHSYLK